MKYSFSHCWSIILQMASPNLNSKTKKSSESSSLFFEGTDKWVESFPTVLIRQVLKRGSFASITYPYKFAFFLAKLGYIPKSLAEYFSLNNQNVLRIPSIREYMNFMKTNEGDWLWMRGEITVCSTYVLYAVVEICMTEYLTRNSKLNKSLREEYLECLYATSKTVLVAVIITQPFTMLSYRQIGQFVGKEEIYSSLSGFIKVFSKPGIYSLIEVTLARYVSHVIQTACGNLASLSWNHWLTGRLSWLPSPQWFLKATDKKTRFHWLRLNLEWIINFSVQYGAAMVLQPLDIAIITSSVWGSGIAVGSEPFMPSGHFLRRFITMWNDGKLFRSASFFQARLTSKISAFVVL